MCNLLRMLEDHNWSAILGNWLVKMRKRILVVDDNELIRRQIRRILESDQQLEICAEAENGVDAVQKARRHCPDLVLIDVFMPEMNGLTAVREIKKTSPNLPVLVFTLHDSGEIQIESQNAGADACLLKANGGIKLLPTLHGLLNRYSEPLAA
jgi:DNA-binding NarL/FixJ family response regulator